MKAFRYIFIIFLLVILIFAGYKIFKKNKEKDEVEKMQENAEEVVVIKDIRYGICNFDSINPLITHNREIIDIDKLIFEPLFNITKDYKLEPCLATECSKTGDTTYVVKIDTNVKWHDGTGITAKDIQFTINTLKNGDSIYKANVENIASTEVIDNTTIKIVLNNPTSFFEYNLTFPILSNVQYYEENMYSSDKVPLGTGRFKIVDINTNSITLSKNNEWRRISTDNSKIETVKISIFPSMGGVFNGFKLGNIDIFRTNNFNYQEYIGTIGFNVTEYPGRDFDFLSINCNDEIMQDKYVRQAINYCIDRNSIVSEVFGNQKIASYYSLDYGNYLYIDDSALNANYEKAKITLENSGWEYTNNEWTKYIDGKLKVLEVNITVQNNNEQRIAVAENIKNQLENMGIATNVIIVSSDNYDRCIINGNYQVLLTGIYNSYSPNVNYLLNDGNINRFHNDDLTTILNTQVSTKNEKLLVENYRKVYEIYKDEIPYIGLYRGKNIIISTQALAGTIVANNYNIFYNIATWYRR